MRSLARCTVAFAAAAWCLGVYASDQQGPRFETLNIFDNSRIEMLSINNRRMIAGTCVQLNEFGEGRLVGFVHQGRFVHPIDFPNASSVFLLGNNDRGELVGLLSRTDNTEIGFRYSRGEIEAIDVPDSTLPPTAHDINNRGDVVGRIQVNFREHGFAILDDQLTLIAVPESEITQPFGINDRRDVVGSYGTLTEPRGTNGFLLRQGIYKTIRVPNMRRTVPMDINNKGHIVGTYSYEANPDHGFLFWNGRYITIDIPGSIQTRVHSINDHGDIVGIYQDSSFTEHAFKSHIREFIKSHR